MKNILLPILGVAIFIIFVGVLTQKLQGGKILTQQTTKQIVVENTKVAVEIAKTGEQRQKGLSGRVTLDANSGMLFVFEKKKVFPSFWMKDMLFPLDIIWIADGKITKIDKNLPIPNPAANQLSTLALYTPDKPIDYVLEVNAGFSDKNNFQVGDSVDLSSI